MNLIKTRIIKGLIDEIMCLDPSNLELVGHKIISILECKRMIHHGINKDNKPCGYTVDSFTDDSMIVAEYSTGKDYFTDSTLMHPPPIERLVKTSIMPLIIIYRKSQTG